jgi:Fur family transcriptional regulator, ferric uptake regulator
MSAQASASGGNWAALAETVLITAGHRRGGARHAVLELLGAQSCALSAIEIEEQLRARGRRVSRASVYRVLEELEPLGLVQRVATGQGMARFERAGGEESHHHHLVCERCGTVRPFVDRALERVVAQLSKRVPLAVSEHEIVLRGQCPDCAG